MIARMMNQNTSPMSRVGAIEKITAETGSVGMALGYARDHDDEHDGDDDDQPEDRDQPRAAAVHQPPLAITPMRPEITRYRPTQPTTIQTAARCHETVGFLS